MEPPGGVVFDLDGLLLDTERLAHLAFTRACGDLQLAVDDEAYFRCIGTTYQRTREILTSAYREALDFERLREFWDGHYHDLVEADLVVKPGALALLQTLEAMGIPVALATSSRREAVTWKLERSGLDQYLEHRTCGGETPHGKPHPQPYQVAAGLLSQTPDRCWACEDSANGVRSAVAAGMTVFQVPDLIQPSQEVRALGHHIVDSLDDVRQRLKQVAGTLG